VTAEAGMRMMLIYCPCPDLATATALGHKLLDARLAGCINILPRMLSLYPWEGRREEAEEAVMIVKTSAAMVAEARAFILREHPYELPAALTLDVADVNQAYGEWLLTGIG
jgi:periplasmic divalent cation tolerance protein